MAATNVIVRALEGQDTDDVHVTEFVRLSNSVPSGAWPARPGPVQPQRPQALLCQGADSTFAHTNGEHFLLALTQHLHLA
jgi:hypothetical protein